MALAFDAASSLGSSAASPTFAHTCTGADRLLLVGIAERYNTGITGVTYAAVALTQLGSWNTANATTVSLWQLIAPATGANNVVVSQSAVDPHNLAISAVSFNGAHQTAPTGTPVQASGSSTTSSVTVTSATGEIVLDIVAALEDTAATVTATVGASQTERMNVERVQGGNGVQGAASTEAGAASVPMTWTLAPSAFWNAAAVAVKPSGGADTTAPAQATVTAAELAVGQAIQLNLTMPSDADLSQYEIRRLTTGSPASTRLDGTIIVAATATTPSATITITDSSLSNGTRYFYRVFLKDTTGNWNTGQTASEVASLPPTVVGWYTSAGVFKSAGDTGASPIFEWTVSTANVETAKPVPFHIAVGSDNPGANLPPAQDLLEFFSVDADGTFKYDVSGVWTAMPATGVPWASVNAGTVTCRWYSTLNATQDLYASVRCEQA